MKVRRWLVAILLLAGFTVVSTINPAEPQLLANGQSRALLTASGSFEELLQLLREWAAKLSGQEPSLAEGITLHHQIVSLGTARAQVDYLRVEDYYPQRYRLTVALPPTGLGTALPLVDLLKTRGAVAGINANFFDPATNLPIGLLLIDGQTVNSSYGRRAVAGIDLFGHLNFFNPITQLSVDNSARLLYAMEDQHTFLRDAVSAGPMLIRNGRSALIPESEGFSAPFSQTRTARSALGLTRDGALILLVVSRSSVSAGMNLPELAGFLQQLGVTEAMALDGGSSSGLAFRQGTELRAIGSQRPIPVALVLLPRR